MILTDKDPMPYGKHKGKAMANVPAPYLIWMHGVIKKQMHRDDVTHAVFTYVEENMDALEKEAKKEKK